MIDVFAFFFSVEVFSSVPLVPSRPLERRGIGGNGAPDVLLAGELAREETDLFLEGRSGGVMSSACGTVAVRLGNGGGGPEAGNDPGILKLTGLRAGSGRSLGTKSGSPFDFHGFTDLFAFSLKPEGADSSVFADLW